MGAELGPFLRRIRNRAASSTSTDFSRALLPAIFGLRPSSIYWLTDARRDATKRVTSADWKRGSIDLGSDQIALGLARMSGSLRSVSSTR